VTLLVAGATSHATEAISREAAQPAQVLGRLTVHALITFIFAATSAPGRVGGAGVDVACYDNRSGLPAAAVLLPRPSVVLVLVLVLLIMPQSVLAILARSVLVPILVAILLLRLLWAVGDEVFWLATLKAHLCYPPRVHPVLVQPLEPPGQQC
jgi:hypothetical protein